MTPQVQPTRVDHAARYTFYYSRFPASSIQTQIMRPCIYGISSFSNAHIKLMLELYRQGTEPWFKKIHVVRKFKGELSMIQAVAFDLTLTSKKLCYKSFNCVIHHVQMELIPDRELHIT